MEFLFQEPRGMGTCVESQGEASVPFPRPLSGGSWDLDHSEGMVPALCTQVFGVLFPAGVTCVDEVVGQLTTVRTPPTHKPPPPPPVLISQPGTRWTSMGRRPFKADNAWTGPRF